MKLCPKCHVEKELLCFYKNRARKDGVDVYCKVCSRETKSPPAPCLHCGLVRKRAVGRQTYCSTLCRFWSKVDKTPGFGPSGTCWKWTGNTCGANRSYGTLWDGKSLVKAHRYSYELLVGPIPRGHEIRHKCDNPACVNPEHLETGTHADNLHDMDERDRRVRGEAYESSKLTDAAVREARLVYVPYSKKFGLSALARRFGVCRYTMYLAISCNTWRHL